MMLTFKTATATIPIVGAMAHPIASGLIESLARAPTPGLHRMLTPKQRSYARM